MFVQNAYRLELLFHTFIIICVHEIENVEINKLLIKYYIYHRIFGNLSMFSFLTRFLTLYIRLRGNLCVFFFLYIYYIYITSYMYTLSFFPFDWLSHLSFLFNLDYPSLVGKAMGKITFTSVWIYTSIIQYEYNIIVFRYASLRFKTTIASNHKNNTDTCFIPWGDVSSKHNNNITTSNKSASEWVIFIYNIILCSYDYYLLL